MSSFSFRVGAMGREGRTGKRIQGAKPSRGIGPRPLDPTMREFLDGLSEIIADQILADEGRGALNAEPLPTTQLGAETC